MNVILIAVAIDYIVTLIAHGFNLLTIMSLVSTVLFMSRKIGHFCKMKTLIGLEGVGIFLDTVYKAIMKSFDWKASLIVVVLRIIFIAIAYYDMTVYVYVKEKHRKGEKEEI